MLAELSNQAADRRLRGVDVITSGIYSYKCEINRSKDMVWRGSQVLIEPRLIWPVEALLGEGPAWFPDEAMLRFVDIKRGRLHGYTPATEARQTVDMGGQPSFVVPADDGTLIVGTNGRLLSVDRGGQIARPIADVAMPTHNRTNDATVDCNGRLWFGTMDDGERQPTGAIWCFDRGTLTYAGGEAVVTNGPAVTSDGRTLYHVDSGSRIIWRCTIGDEARLVDQTAFLRLTKGDGHPDGIVLDSDDCLWVALWDGWGVRRYSPAGELLLTVTLPCARVTKIAFCGPDLRTAYVTTARVGLDAAALARQPLAGGLFAFEAPVAGNVLPTVRLSS